MRIIFASHNENKVEEIRSLLPKNIELLSLKDINYIAEIEETGTTLEENSALKAKTIFIQTGIPTIADDTGLEVYALNMEPGVYSARYAGEQKCDEDNISKLLRSLEGSDDRKARFRTIFTYCAAKTIEQFEGIVEGEISSVKKGCSGFGYDPIFHPENKNITFAEMTLEEKNKTSHRARALMKLVNYFNTQKEQ
jgi:XTP/dITP diphosphohydrolase